MDLKMSSRIIRLLIPVLVTLAFPIVCGCKDKRIDSVKPQDREVKVDAPGANVTVDRRGEMAAPRAGNEVDVDVGAGGVQVDIDAPALRERLREAPRKTPE
jgi:hypothetical protein